MTTRLKELERLAQLGSASPIEVELLEALHATEKVADVCTHMHGLLVREHVDLRAKLDAANARLERLREALVDLLEKWKSDVRAGRGPTLGMADRINAALAESKEKP